MKTKLALAALCALLVNSASAAAFQWTATGVTFDGSRLASSSAVTGYLIFLGNGGSYDSSYSIDTSSTASSVLSAVGTEVNSANTTTKAGKLAGTYSFGFENGEQTNGDVFALMLVYAASDATYVNLSSQTYTLSGLADDTSAGDTAAFTFSWSTAAEGTTSVGSGSGWTQVPVVPEPSTAALALAGLVLLLKRRKA